MKNATAPLPPPTGAPSPKGRAYWVKNMPIIPTIGTKGIPSAVPPAIRQNRRSFKSAFTLAVHNGTTRQTLLAKTFRQQLVGESPAPYPKRLTPFRSRCVGNVDTRQPSQGFSHISDIVTYSQKLCKYFLHIAPKKLRPHQPFRYICPLDADTQKWYAIVEYV